MTMLEKAAKALAKFADDDFTENRQFWIEHTLVVLQAIRVPDEETVFPNFIGEGLGKSSEAVEFWNACLDAIRSGK